MLFKELRNHAPYLQTQKHLKIREDFHKKVRRQVLNEKLSMMRKQLFFNLKNNYKPQDSEQWINEEVDFLSNFDKNYAKEFQQSIGIGNEKSSRYTIVKSFSILSKFYKMQIESGEIFQIKKMMNKIDAIICLLINLDGWIQEDKQKRKIQQQISQCQSIKCDNFQESQSILQQQKDWNELDKLKHPTWAQQQNSKSKMQLLKEIILLIIFPKLQNCLSAVQEMKSFENEYAKEKKNLISITVIKWLFFYEENMKMFCLKSNQFYNFKETLQEKNQHCFQELIAEYYFNITLKVLKSMLLEETIDIFFNSVEEIPSFKGSKQLLQDLKTDIYITCSPFQYLIGVNQLGIKFLKDLAQIIEAKIEQKDRTICIQKIKSLSLNQPEDIEKIAQITKEEIQLEKAKKILQYVNAKLQNETKRKAVQNQSM